VSRGGTTPAVADRADRIAGGLQRLGVKQGDSVCILMRNDIAFIEAAYAAMRLAPMRLPINWHFKPEEINYVLKDSGTAGADRPSRHASSLRDAIPTGITVLSARRRRKFSQTTRSIPPSRYA
jgi:long-chain acyl-CoA synthetase